MIAESALRQWVLVVRGCSNPGMSLPGSGPVSDLVGTSVKGIHDDRTHIHSLGMKSHDTNVTTYRASVM